MLAVIGLGLAGAGGLSSVSLDRKIDAAQQDAELVERQRSNRSQRHSEWMALMEKQRSTLPAEYERQSTFAQAAAYPHRHVRLDLSNEVIMLVEDGYVVRRSPVKVGEARPADETYSAVDITKGLRIIDERIRDGRFELPGWAGWQGERPEPQRKRSRRKRRRKLPKPIDGLYGARTLVLDDGAVLYSTPGWGPWASAESVRPGGVELNFTDMASIFGAVSTGTRVYVY